MTNVGRDELSREAWAAISAVFFGDEMHTRFHDAATAAGVPHPGALKAILNLDAEQPRSMRTMAEELRCDASYVTALVDALEELGYVERRMSPIDRRVKLVHLTTAGEEAKQRAQGAMSEPPKVLDRLTDAEIKTLARLASKLL
jgi:DNA-binding MarR family transcriptional regulator